jgi:hypothetical protein
MGFASVYRVEYASFPEEQKIRLEKALTDAGVNHLVETYSGLRHGSLKRFPLITRPSSGDLMRGLVR